MKVGDGTAEISRRRKPSPTVWTGVPAGEVVASDTSNWRCRNTLAIKVPDRERVFRAVKGVQNDTVVALGDQLTALSHLAGARDIEVVRLDQL